MLNIVIFGAPGSGKGTQSELLIKNHGLKYVSTGGILRDKIKKGTPMGKLADSYISKGQLVPDDLVIPMLEDLINDNSSSNGFIFDGFPRTLAQGEALDVILSKLGKEITLVFSLEVDDDELMARLLNRGKDSGRSDDNLRVIESRLEVFHKQTAPLKTFYAKQGKLIEIKGVGTIEEIFDSIEKVITMHKEKWQK